MMYRTTSSIKTVQLKKAQSGFTIIELLIATTVLTVILLMVTVMISNIGNLYYKGITLAQTQDTTRSIADAVSQDIKLNDKPPVSDGSAIVFGTSTNAICIGSVRYTYTLGRQIGTNLSGPDPQVQHVLWRDTIGSGSACTPVNLALATPPGVGGSELIGPRSRLTAFKVAPSSLANPTLFTVQIGVAFGDYDLLNMAGIATTCNGGVGGQFCAVDALTTSAIQRIGGS